MTSTTSVANHSTRSPDAAPADLPPMAAAKAPVGHGPVPAIGIVLSLAVIGLGVVGIRDALVSAGAIEGETWISSVVELFDGWRPELWLVPVGVLLVLLGLWLLLVAVRPRPRTGIAVRAETGVYLRAADVKRIAVRAAADVDGVLTASADASRRKVDVQIATTGDSSTAERVRAAVQEVLQPLEVQPTVRVKVAGGRS